MIHRVSVRCSVSNVFDNLLKSFKVSVWAIQVDIDSASLVEDEAVDELAELFCRFQGAHNACSITDHITVESELPTYSEFADDHGMMNHGMMSSWQSRDFHVRGTV